MFVRVDAGKADHLYISLSVDHWM